MKVFNIFATLLTLFCLTFGLSLGNYYSQATYHYVGTNNLQNTNSSFPSIYGNFFRGVKHQILVKATELQSAGISAGNITGLAFDIVSNSGNVLNGFEIEMKSTTQQSLSTWSNNNLATYFGPASYTDQIGWNQHNFSSPFYWDGTSNIVIQTCFYNNSWSQNAIMNMTNYAYNSLIYRRRDNSSPCNSNWINGVETQKPNIRFSWVDPNSPPISDFSTSGTSTCSGLVNFYDQTSNSPNNWFWNFGDGNTSTQQNPTHSYNSSGNYTVELITSNSFGSDTITYSNLIQVNLANTPPIAPSCIPTTGIAGSIGNYGITEFNFGNLSNISGSSVEGYSDFTCDSSLFYIGQTYNLSATHISLIPQNFFAWIDFNNNGVFETSTEQIVSNLVSGDSTSATVSIPSFGVVNTPLRLRIMSDASFSGQLNPCTDPVYGQAEDYTIYLAYNFSPPIADFESNINYSCDGIVEFSDLSTNVPYAWFWDFGDGNTSISQNPTHNYINNGIYDVTLISSNFYGSDSITFTQYIEIDSTNLVLSAGPNPITTSYCCDYGISRVQFSNLNNPSLDGIDGYVDYSCEFQASVEPGTNYALRIYTGPTNSQDTRAWIDYNNDGVFSNNEKVMEKINQFDPVSIVQIPSNIVVNTPIRLRISSDEVGNNNGPTDNVNRGQVEDYAIIVATCEDPSNIVIGQTSNTSVELNWQAGGNEDSWNIRYGPEGFGVFSGLGVTVNNIFVNNYFVTGLEDSISYDFYVQSNCSNNSSNWIGPLSSTTNIITKLYSENVSVYPNPNNKIFSTQSTKKIVKIEVLDILGSQIKTIELNTNFAEINISENPSGVYFLKISLENGNIITKKIVCK